MPTKNNNCPLCDSDGGTLIWRDDRLRLIHTPEPGFPAFYRVVWNKHASELSDLTADDRNYYMDTIVGLEKILRDVLSPNKINIASLGNMVPHLHFHVIARFAWDSHFPEAIWAQALRELDSKRLQQIEQKLSLVESKLSAGV